MKNKAYIMRGLPGSGKTTWASKHILGARRVSADDYFNRFGSYQFNAGELPRAHAECLLSFLYFVQLKVDIIVDNTNIRAWEASPYVAIAEAHGYDVEIINVRAPVDVCIARNIHGVPEKTIRDMFRALNQESLPPWWKTTIVE